MSTLSQFGFGGGIKSIQRGTIQLPSPINDPGTAPITQTQTITAVNTSKSILYYLGVRNGRSTTSSTNFAGSTGFAVSVLAMIELTNSTTITATIGYSFGTQVQTFPPTVSWQLVEYY